MDQYQSMFYARKSRVENAQHMHFLLLSVRYRPTFQAPLFCSQHSNIVDTSKMCKRPNVPDASNKYLEKSILTILNFQSKVFQSVRIL